MNIQIKHEDNDTKINVIVCYDKCGNIYFQYEEDYYFLMISDEAITIEQSHNMKKLLGHSQDVLLGKLKNSCDEKSLKGKILNKLESEENKDNDTESESDEQIETNERFFPEQKYYYHEDIEDNELNEEEFKFYVEGESVLKYLDVDLNAFANYNTIVMNPHTKIIEMTLESNMLDISYIMTIYTTGQIDLNIIGSKRKSFILSYKYNEIVNNENNDQDKMIFGVKCIGICRT